MVPGRAERLPSNRPSLGDLGRVFALYNQLHQARLPKDGNASGNVWKPTLWGLYVPHPEQYIYEQLCNYLLVIPAQSSFTNDDLPLIQVGYLCNVVKQ